MVIRKTSFVSATAAIGCVALVACSSVQKIGNNNAPALDQDCRVDVYLTYQQATKDGPIDELCLINGTSSGSFSHTIATAIEKHKHKACGCGANAVYIQSQTQSGLDVATVTLVAFRFSSGDR